MHTLHLVIDGYARDRAPLTDVDLVHEFLDGFPARIGMTKIAPPQVYTYHGKKDEDWGVSGFVLIAESHISVHTFPERKYLNVDIFSCKPFDADESAELVKRRFGLRRIESRVLERGLEYLSDREAYSGMVRERVELSASGDTSGGDASGGG